MLSDGVGAGFRPTTQIILADVVVREMSLAVGSLLRRDVSLAPHELLQQCPCLVHDSSDDARQGAIARASFLKLETKVDGSREDRPCQLQLSFTLENG